VTFTDDRNNAETLTSAATVEVAAAPAPLTVRLKVAAPATHDGSSEFTRRRSRHHWRTAGSSRLATKAQTTGPR
jgi:hypothetical protein